jgi:hypothetical protein
MCGMVNHLTAISTAGDRLVLPNTSAGISSFFVRTKKKIEKSHTTQQTY